MPGALFAGAVAGILGEVLVLRLNPDVVPNLSTFAGGIPLWASWGAFLVGLPLWLISAAVSRPFTRLGLRRGEALALLLAAVYLLAASLSWVNAEIHTEFHSSTGLRQLRQDATMWLTATVIVGLATAWWRTGGRRRGHGRALLALSILLPVLRLVGEPTTFRRLDEVTAAPLGRPSRPLLVCGVKGLDQRFALDPTATRALPTLDQLARSGAWGPLDPFQPFLEQAYWTTLATGTLPRSHGVMFRWGWQVPVAFDGTLRLLPWTPKGSRLFLAWDRGRRVEPPPSSLPPLWQRLAVTGVTTDVTAWPGIWEAGAGVRREVHEEPVWSADPSLQSYLETLLAESFPNQAGELLATIRRDEGRVRAALAALAAGTDSVWLVLDGLDAARRALEPQGPMDAVNHEVLDLVLELLDEQLGRLLAGLPPEALAAVVSTNGLAPPDPTERLLRLVGLGGDWRASAVTCPDGFLVLLGDGVAGGGSFPAARLEDVAPTLCYLLDLPVAQYMEGRVILDAVEPEWLARHPLKVVD